MKKVSILLLIIFFAANAFGQNKADLQKIYDTEKAFEKMANEQGIRRAFLANLADEAVVFEPTATNGKEFWTAHKESPAALFWNPNFVDVSSNGALAYTTGNSVYRPKGKDDPNAYFGEYATVWQRQPDGNYKAVLDIGISHEKPATIETAWKSPAENNSASEAKTSATAAAQSFFETAQNENLARAYKNFAADDARFLREGSFPILSKTAAIESLKKDKSAIKFSKRLFFVGAGDLAYLSDTYTVTKNKNAAENGNLVQVWKLRSGVWQIVLDVMSPVKK